LFLGFVLSTLGQDDLDSRGGESKVSAERLQQQLLEAMSRLPEANPFEVTAHVLSTFRFVLDVLKGDLASSEDLVFNEAKCKPLKDMATVTLLQLFRMVSVFADQV
jgi:hypothetical protein